MAEKAQMVEKAQIVEKAQKAQKVANANKKAETDDPNVVTEKELRELRAKSVRFFPSRSHGLISDIRRIQLSDKYSDDAYEYRHVILPKLLYKLIPQEFMNPDKSGTLRLLSEPEWRAIGIMQGMGWQHYEVHGEHCISILCLGILTGMCSTRATYFAFPASSRL
jgi:hypothetical protein